MGFFNRLNRSTWYLLVSTMGLALPLALAFQNCSGFKSDESEKEAFLANQRVFGTSRINQPSTNDGDRGFDHDNDQTTGSTPSDTPSKPTDRPLSVPVVTACSNVFTSMIGGNITSSESLTLDFIDGTGAVACSYKSKELLSTLVDLRILEIKNISENCPGLGEGVYDLSLKSPTSRNLMQRVKFSGGTFDAEFVFSIGSSFDRFNYQVRVLRGEHNEWVVEPADQTHGYRPLVLYKTNPYGSEGYRPFSEAVDQHQCNYAVSPLLLQLGDGSGTSQPVEFTAPELGRLFDILGETSFPVRHVKEMISWFTGKTAQREFFITLPNELGEVNGINEMFGNTTRGPDGRFADNGYLALEKYDGRTETGNYDKTVRDRRIDRNDEVYAKLRLWADDNQDAIAQSSELRSLEELKIKSIDLNYDASYLEIDRYGNETRFKSIARTDDGKIHLVYDIWFVVGK